MNYFDGRSMDQLLSIYNNNTLNPTNITSNKSNISYDNNNNNNITIKTNY